MPRGGNPRRSRSPPSARSSRRRRRPRKGWSCGSRGSGPRRSRPPTPRSSASCGSNFDRNVHDDEFFSLTERLDLAAQAAPWRLYLRVDGFSPWNHDSSCSGTEADLCYLRSNWRPGSYDGSAPNNYANVGNLLLSG
ncbi:MAG: hypothetical protein U0324_39290 [Polyangiales bacterium]